MPRIMFYRLPVEGARDVFESEFGPIEYVIVEAEDGAEPPAGYIKDHTQVYAAKAEEPAPAPKKRKKAEPVEEPEAESEGE